MLSTAPWTQICEDRNFADWHRGCPWCAVWVVWADAPALAAAVHAGRQALGPALLPRYARQPHLTVAYRGLCAADDAHPAVEYGRAGLRADVARLQALNAAPFALQLQGADSFSTVPYLAVAQGQDRLAQLHTALEPQPPVADWVYVPHVTLGHYARALPLAHAVAQLQAAGVGQAPLTLSVQQLALVRYATGDIAGPLWLEGWFDLRSQRYTAQPGAVLAL